MMCPNCYTDNRFKTIDTRHRSWGVKRIKVCPKCGHHLATIEIYKVSDEALASLTISQYAIDTREFDRRK